MKGFLLFLVAFILLFPLTIINFFLVGSEDYFRDTALNIDRFANREFRTLWNKTLITKNTYAFGNPNETISAVLGHNIILGNLSKTGKVLVWILSKKHCLDAIEN